MGTVVLGRQGGVASAGAMGDGVIGCHGRRT
jgi:hypothetical protein